MTNTEKLKELIKQSGYKYNFLASKIGITRAAFTMKVNGVTSFKVEEMYILRELIPMTDEEARDIFFAQM